jgi:hypothetical protein
MPSPPNEAVKDAYETPRDVAALCLPPRCLKVRHNAMSAFSRLRLAAALIGSLIAMWACECV